MHLNYGHVKKCENIPVEFPVQYQPGLIVEFKYQMPRLGAFLVITMLKSPYPPSPEQQISTW
jgi:hypothetical protein